jgi:hypothetical protein
LSEPLVQRFEVLEETLRQRRYRELNGMAAMAKAVVEDAMQTRYGIPGVGIYALASAMDVLDLAPDKIRAMRVVAWTTAASKRVWVYERRPSRALKSRFEPNS